MSNLGPKNSEFAALLPKNTNFQASRYPPPMDAEVLAPLISVFAAIAIVTASFFQWWDVRDNGELRTKWWARYCSPLSS
jgi:hypothetical protein